MKNPKAILAIISCILIIGCSTAYKSITAAMPDLASKSDGVYRGNYNLSGVPVKTTLDVTVQNKKIVKIEIIQHSCSPIGKKAEKIIDNIITSQNLDVDAVTGATASSKTILKAVENALQ